MMNSKDLAKTKHMVQIHIMFVVYIYIYIINTNGHVCGGLLKITIVLPEKRSCSFSFHLL
jgi:hypothetical protein